MDKIFFLIDDISCSGGTERVTCTLGNLLAEKGYDVNILTLHLSQKKNRFQLNEKIKIIQFNESNKLRSIYCSVKKTKENKGVLIVISMGKLSLTVALASLLQRPKKIIFAEHISLSSFGFLKRIIKKLSYFMADNVVFLTEHDKNLVDRRENDKYLNIKNINPFYSSHCDITPYKNRPNVAIAIGRYGYQKNFERLIRLWKKANIKDWKLIIIGNDNSLLKKLTNDDDSIEICDATNNIEFFYNQAKLILMTSRYEGLPMVLIEAQHFGIPAIAFDCKTGPKEIIQHGYSGFVINYNDDDKFIETLKKATSNEKLLSDMSLNSQYNALNYSPEKIINKWTPLF
ncbi:glycosyltransferase [Escherichia coli]|uniref:glycosyltransferase n=1 Tax=Escherichia coli TaxID=562 RepID=UPI001F0F3B50|nr:glycosyltransferase [Escherichia coli]MCH4702918.1 glycosyltransferase [Escherichia coli]MCH4721024.1 glycosyltransferase [Escherichia coli]MCH4739049.1 glycosyltransferase [Escherichia coli]HCP7638019.1 glycosyltransferase [Escherichia coli]